MSRWNSAAYKRSKLFVPFLLIVMLSLSPLVLIQMPASAQVETTPILLGEFVRESMTEGDEALFALSAPIDGVYTIVVAGDSSASDFLLAVVDENGESIYDDVMQDVINVELSAGEYVLVFTAQTDARLEFTTGIEAGTMSTDIDAPGELFNGATFLTENVTAPLYARLTIEPSAYPQQMAVLVQGGDGDIYEAELTSEAFDYATISTDEAEAIQMVTTGGVYDLTITPIEGGESLQVSIFLSGPAPALEIGVETEGALEDGEDADTFQFEVTATGTIVVLTANSESSLNLSVGTAPEESTWSTYSFGGEPVSLSFIAPEAGIYFAEISTDNEEGAAYTVLVEEDGQAEPLMLNEPMTGQVAAGSVTGFLVELEEPEQFLIVLLVGPDGVDLDLSVKRYVDGQEASSDSSTLFGSREIAALYADEPGAYIVVVDGSWSDVDAPFVVVASNGPAADLLDLLGDAGASGGAAADVPSPSVNADGSVEQWVADAEASSEYSDEDWSAQQVTGAADTVVAGDEVTAWAALNADAQQETLRLTFAQAVIPTAIEIYETYNPGAVSMIEVLDPNTDAWVVVWEGVADTIGEEMAVFSPALSAVDFAVSQVRLTIDEPAVPGWNEIDAVKLIGVAE